MKKKKLLRKEKGEEKAAEKGNDQLLFLWFPAYFPRFVKEILTQKVN